MHPPELTHSERVFGYIVLTPLIVALAFVMIRNAIATRRWLLSQAAQLLACVALVIALELLLMRIGFKGWWIEYVAIFFATAVYSFKWKPSRRIPAHIRKRVIARHLRRGGTYDPKTDCVDHIYPFSKHGGHSLDNLQVISRKDNQRKGSREPGLIEWLRFTFRR